MKNTPLFANRTQAGEQLAQAIYTILTQQTADQLAKPLTIVYALPRGGIPVAAPVARLLNCPLMVEVAKKISHPENPELAIGAVTASGNVLWDEHKLSFRDTPKSNWRQAALDAATSQAKFLQAQLSPACPQVNTEGATMILVDDGIATGMTIAVAATSLKALSPAEVWLCTPVAPLELLPWLDQWGDRVIVLSAPKRFFSVSNFYSEFPQLETNEAFECLLQQNEQMLKKNTEHRTQNTESN
ncbi:phosphoribosyltransferase family protein [Brasilonema sp. UFV-L1]|uniref:phosphoribosyltransferase n=1 Tax=Brasilonema sp. UFV-L1 TaxID=2234130 RepID=UPI00145D4A8E|nr:phosphoribosyltransferase family protein [Brasilonema sp. UFV-L1]NMG07338.1 phosphoribosyltransferase [Brasilonema sp. UFV-L1]